MQKLFVISSLTSVILATVPFLGALADQYYPPSGGGGTGTVLGGDGVIENVSPTGGFLTAATAAANTVLGNPTGSTAAPSYTSNPVTTSLTSTTVTAPVTVQTITTDSDSSTITFNLSTSNWHNVVLGGNRTLALSNATTGQQFTIQLTQPASGGPDTVTWFSGITWNGGGSAPVLQTAANAVDTITFKCTGTGAYIGYPTQNLNPSVTTVTAQKSISSGTSPTIVVTSGGGTGSPTAGFTGTAHDESGQITFTSGATPSGTVLTVTYGNPAYTTAPNPVVCGASANGITGAPYVSSQSTTGFAITLSGILTTSTTYLINYIVKQ